MGAAEKVRPKEIDRSTDRSRELEREAEVKKTQGALVANPGAAPAATVKVADALTVDAHEGKAPAQLNEGAAAPLALQPPPSWAAMRKATKLAKEVKNLQIQLGTTLEAKLALEGRKLTPKDEKTLQTLRDRETTLRAKLKELGAEEAGAPMPMREEAPRIGEEVKLDLPSSLYASPKEIEKRAGHEQQIITLIEGKWTTQTEGAAIARRAGLELEGIGRTGPDVLTKAEVELIAKAIENAPDVAHAKAIVERVATVRELQARILQHDWSTPKEASDLAKQLRTEKEALSAETGIKSKTGPIRTAILESVDYLEQVMGRFADEYGPKLQKAGESKENARYMAAMERYNEALRGLIDGTGEPDAHVRAMDEARKVIEDPSSTASKVYKTVGWILTNMMTYEALRHTGLQTTWGFRTYIPGTFGIGGNVGPWLQTYSGTLNQYQAQAVPFRLNPGATLSLPFLQASYSRAGFGSGFNLPMAQSYVDPVRYRMLFGMDGVGFVSMGEWQHRGSYLQVSGSIPLGFIPVSITWAGSLFNPGLAPLVRKTRPLAIATQAIVTKGVSVVTGKPVKTATP